MMGWRIVDRRIGRAGGEKQRSARQRAWDQKYGEGEWAIGYVVNGEFIDQVDAYSEIYELSYLVHFESHPEDLDFLVSNAKELRNPHAEATTGGDLQVPAIESILLDKGLKLTGNEVVDIGTWKGQGSHPISVRLSPLQIKCCLNEKWTLEKFWQEAKVLRRLGRRDESKPRSMNQLISFLIAIFLFSFSTTAAEKPDIVMIAIDDLRPMLGCYGDRNIKTPNIDTLAARGVVFERAYCQYAKCGTSRLSLMTGLRPDSVNVFSNNERDLIRFQKARPDAVSMGQWLKNKAGYHTQSWGKIYHDGWDDPADWSVASSPGREREMWEVVDSENRESSIIAERWECPVMQSPDVADDFLFAGKMTNSVIETLKDRDSIDKPLFLAVGFRRPHLPFVAPKKYFDWYQPNDSWLAKNPIPSQKSPVMAWFNSDGYVGGAKKQGLSMPPRPSREEGVAWNGYEMRSYLGVPPEGEISKTLQLQLLHAYAACVSYVDAQIGRLLAEVSDDTVVILWSDHGWHLGEQSAWGKMTNFEIATRVPLIISAPKMKDGRTSSLTELVDLYPTICDLAKVEKPKHLEGDSLIPVLENPELGEVEGVALSQYARFGKKFMGYAMRTNRYRAVVWIERETGNQVSLEIYDHENDPQEMTNLAGEDPLLDRTLIKQTLEKHGQSQP